MKPTLRESWVWLLGLYTAASFGETIFWGQMAAFTPLFLRDLGVAAGEVPRLVGIVAAITGAAGIPFLPLWGALADRFSRQPLIVRSFVAYLLAGTVAALAGNVWVFVLGRSLMSLSLGNSGLMLTTLAERTPTNRHGLAFAVMNSAGPSGAFLGPLLGGPVVDHWGFRALLLINLVVMVVIVLALTFGYSDAYRGRSRAPILRMAGESVRITFGTPRLRSLFAALFLLFAGWMLAFNYLPVVVSSLYHGDNPASAIGLVLGGGGLVSLILSPALGWLADRRGHWRILLLGAGLETMLWLVPFWTRDLLRFGVAWAVLSGLAAAVFSISFNVLAGSAAAEVRGRVMSFAYLPVNLGFFLGPALGSRLVELGLFAIFPAAFVLTALGLLALIYARRQPSPV